MPYVHLSHCCCDIFIVILPTLTAKKTSFDEDSKTAPNVFAFIGPRLGSSSWSWSWGLGVETPLSSPSLHCGWVFTKLNDYIFSQAENIGQITGKCHTMRVFSLMQLQTKELREERHCFGSAVPTFCHVKNERAKTSPQSSSGVVLEIVAQPSNTLFLA